MVRYLIQRPIAVIMCFIALAIAGLTLIWKVPVSLLPNIDVPQIVVKVNFPNTAASTLEQNILRPIRETLGNCSGMKHVESRAANHTGLVYLTYDFSTRMDLAVIEVNEKLDRLANGLPKEMPRPQVMRINTSDIPVIRVQVTPKAGISLLQVTELTEKIIKKRLEQLEGVSLVDINGKQLGLITITPDKQQLIALGIREDLLIQTVQNANRELGGLSVQDGQYRYFVKLGNVITSAEQIGQIPVKIPNGSVLPLQQLALIQPEPETPVGYHLYNGKESLVITVQKQPGSRMNELVPAVKEVIEQFNAEYPQVDFALTQDQTFLLDAGIDNLFQDIVFGGLLTVLLLFLFLGNWQSATLMSISIPLSLVITFIFFYLFNISFNIISLSGLALGIGMLIDNSIVVIDNITRKRISGLNMVESSVQGTNEVMAPVISQVLTTVAVYAPLILLSGIAGALVFEQSIALTISLMVSLLVAFILSPLLYKLLLKTPPEKLKEDTFFYTRVSNGYHKMITHILRHKLKYIFITVLLMPIGVWLGSQLPVSSLPRIEKKESLLKIDWNAPIDARENLTRVKQLQQHIQSGCTVSEAEVGIRQFLLQQETNTIDKADLYYACINESQKMQQDEKVKKWMQQHFPTASFDILDAPNAFTQLFTSTTPYLEARFKPLQHQRGDNAWKSLDKVISLSPDQHFTKGGGLISERSVDVILQDDKMILYGVTRNTLENKLQQLFGNYTVTDLKRYGESKTLQLKTGASDLEAQLAIPVEGTNNTSYPLSNFISTRYTEQPRFITADKTGEYKSIVFDSDVRNLDKLRKQLSALAQQHGYSVSFSGLYFENQQQITQLWKVFFIVLALLYIILAIQYESLILPLLVMLTIPLGVSGGMLMLWLTGGTLDVMAAIGFVVVLGLIVDDPILKIETLNRLEKKYRAQQLPMNNQLLEKMIHEAGHICLKPLLMVSLTTSIAMVPVLFISGIGNDLQKPLALVIIGGLTIGTFFTTWFIPLAYWYVIKWKK